MNDTTDGLAPRLPPRRTEEQRLNIEQKRRIDLLDKWAAGLKDDAALYCDDHDIRLAPALRKIDDAMEQLHEIIEDDAELQRWVSLS